MNLHTHVYTVFEGNTIRAIPGTEVVGELPRLVVMGDLAELDLKEAAARIKWGFDLVSSFVDREEQREVTLIDENNGDSSLLAKEAGDRGWAVEDISNIFGSEADYVVVVGPGSPEAVSRARLCVAILLSFHSHEMNRLHTNMLASQYQEAIEQGLVEVAIPPWHPQV